MTDRTRGGLVGTFVVLVHVAIAGLVKVPAPPSPPAPAPKTTWIGLSAPALPEVTGPPLARATNPAPAVTKGQAPGTSTPMGQPGEVQAASPTTLPEPPGGSTSDTQEDSPAPAPPIVLQTPPRISTQDVLARLVYPPLALRRRIEATVVLELMIDEVGTVVPTVVEDPGHGFAEAAVRALEGLVVTPARVGDKPVASRLRYPVRFVLP